MVLECIALTTCFWQTNGHYAVTPLRGKWQDGYFLSLLSPGRSRQQQTPGESQIWSFLPPRSLFLHVEARVSHQLWGAKIHETILLWSILLDRHIFFFGDLMVTGCSWSDWSETASLHQHSFKPKHTINRTNLTELILYVFRFITWLKVGQSDVSQQ